MGVNLPAKKLPSQYKKPGMHYTYEIIRTVIKAFEDGKKEEVLLHLHDDAEWHRKGEQTITGKEAIFEFIDSEERRQNPQIAITQNHFIVYGDEGVVAGEVTIAHKDGNPETLHYCDIYEVEDGKVRKIFSYLVADKN